MKESRDGELGNRLETIVEPDHAPDYWPQLRRRIAGERQRTAGFTARLAAALGSRRVRLGLAAAALAAVAAAAVLFGLPRSSGTQTVNAATVVKRALAAQSSGRTWQADVTLKVRDWNRSLVGYHYDYVRYRLLQGADGSFRLTQMGPISHGTFVAPASARPVDTLVYDASTGVLRHARPGHVLTITRNLAPGPPDVPASPITGVDFGASGRAMQASGAFTLAATVADGRPAWTVTCTLGTLVAGASPPPNVEWPVYKVTTDRETWLPIRFQQISGGVLIADLRYLHIRHDAPLPSRAFTVKARPNEPVRRVDKGFHRLALEAAAATPGVLPLVPGFVPAGFTLAQTAVASRGVSANRLVTGRDVFALQYQHGFDSLTVSTRTIADPYYSRDEDPFDLTYSPSWTAFARSRVRITNGAFAGAAASIIVATTSSTPHLWAVKDGVLLTIGGGATARELLAVADSLQGYPTD